MDVHEELESDETMLIASTNAIVSEVQQYLPHGWEIEMRLDREECSLTLLNPECDEVDVGPVQEGTSRLTQMIDYAIAADMADDTVTLRDGSPHLCVGEKGPL